MYTIYQYIIYCYVDISKARSDIEHYTLAVCRAASLTTTVHILLKRQSNKMITY